MLLGIDVGTTGAKAAVFDEDGLEQGYAFQEYGFRCPLPGRAEQDAEEIWRITKDVIRRAAGGMGREIGALSLSVQGDAVIAIDRDRNAISPAFLGMDYRGMQECRFCEETCGAANLYHTTGMRPHPMNSIIKILWIKNHMPQLYEKAYKFVTYADFLLGKLGSDELVIDYSMASRTMAFDLQKRSWSAEILNSLGISEQKLSRPVPSGTPVGRLSRSLAEELSLAKGTMLVSGGHDQPCAALGAGILEEGMALDSHGTAEVLSTVFTKSRINDTMFNSYYPCSIHTIADRYFTFALNHTGGASLKWFIDNFCQKDKLDAAQQGKQVYDYVFSHFPKRPSAVMVLPHFNGSGTPACDLDSKGAFVGLTLATDRFDIAKGIVEALSYEMKINLIKMREAGIFVNRLRVVGGGARSPVGLQNKADILGIPVASLKVREAACLGAAMLAGTAAGIYKRTDDLSRLAAEDTVYTPDTKAARLYGERFPIYAQLYEALRNTAKKLSQLESEGENNES